MPYGISEIDRSCGSYGPGHQVHWIQAKKSWEEGPEITVSKLVVHADGLVDLKGPELELTMWNHDPDRLRSVLNDHDRRADWKPRFHVLAVPGPSGYLFNLAALHQRTPCHPGARRAAGEPTSDFVVRAAREDHGVTVPLRSLLAPDVAAGQEKNEPQVDT